MSGLEITLGAAALLIGLTGAWSPCGFSMVETIGPSGHSGGRPTTAAALATFVPGALIGGVATFGALALLGSAVHGAAGRTAYAVAAIIAIAAALAEARGTPIVPQIRRQLPEHWRRIMPMPLAAGLYGILLGLGFTTFVLSFGVWALAGISFAVGSATTGIVIGLAFGAGRALPVLLLAPVCERPSGIRATEAMTQRPGLYLGARRGDAVALIASAIALTVAPAGATVSVIKNAADPSATGTDLVFERGGGTAVLRRAGSKIVRLPGTDPAIGGPYVAVRQGDTVALLNRRTLTEVGRVDAPGADALAVSASWLAYRVHGAEGDDLRVRSISRGEPGAGVAFGPESEVARASSPGGLGRPSLDGRTLVYSRATESGNGLAELSLPRRKARFLLATRRLLVSAPSVQGAYFSYLLTTNERQEVRVRRLRGRGLGRLVYSLPATSRRDQDRGAGHRRLPTRVPPPDRRRTNTAIAGTTLAGRSVYLTFLEQRRGRVSARIAHVGR